MYHDETQWKECFQLALDLHKAVEKFPPFEKYGLAAQVRKSSMKIPVAVARFFSFRLHEDRLKALQWINSYAVETQVYLEIAHALGYFNDGIELRDGFFIQEKSASVSVIDRVKKITSWAQEYTQKLLESNCFQATQKDT